MFLGLLFCIHGAHVDCEMPINTILSAKCHEMGRVLKRLGTLGGELRPASDVKELCLKV